MVCPLCQHQRDRVIEWPYLSPLALELAKRIDPTWEPEHGCCQVCLDALLENAARAEKEPVPVPKDLNYRSYHRYVMNERERIQWNHQNSELREPFRERISDEACAEAMDRGVDCYLIIDGENEEVVAQGAANPFLD